MVESPEERQKKIEKLDNAFLFVISLIGLLFTIIQFYREGVSGLIEIAPLLVLGTVVPFYIGYIRGAIECNTIIERVRGWVYLTVGVIAYFAFFIESFGVSFDVGLLVYFLIITFGAFSVYYLEKWFSKFFGIQDKIANRYAFYGTMFAGVGFAYVSRLIVLAYNSLQPALQNSDFIITIILTTVTVFLTSLAFEKMSRQVLDVNLTLIKKQVFALERFRNRIYVMPLELVYSLLSTLQKKKPLLLDLTIIYAFISIFLVTFPIVFNLLILSSVVCYSLGIIQFLRSGKTDFSNLGKSINLEEVNNHT